MKMIILCPIEASLREAPDHLLFATKHLEEQGRISGHDINVRFLYYSQRGYSRWRRIVLNVILAIRIMCIKHHILYCGTETANIVLLALLKRVGLYRKDIYAWKYVAIKRNNNPIETLIKRIVFNGFTRLFMVTKKHVVDSSYLIDSNRMTYFKWGIDLEYIDRFVHPQNRVFTFITTGKAYRDFDTLCQAFFLVHSAQLIIITENNWGGIDYKEMLMKYQSPKIKVVFTNEMKGNILDYIYLEMHKAHCALTICQKVNWGVGYTQILDSMACSLPVIATYNNDNPLDIDSLGIGCTVPPEDPEALASAMQKMVDDHDWASTCSAKARSLTEKEYNIRRVAKDVIRIITQNESVAK